MGVTWFDAMKVQENAPRLLARRFQKSTDAEIATESAEVLFKIGAVVVDRDIATREKMLKLKVAQGSEPSSLSQGEFLFLEKHEAAAKISVLRSRGLFEVGTDGPIGVGRQDSALMASHRRPFENFAAEPMSQGVLKRCDTQTT
jgi:hypothetical protein